MEKLTQYLNAQGTAFTATTSCVEIQLRYNLRITVCRNEDESISISNRLKGFNCVTGMLELSLEKSLIYNSVLLALYGFYSILSDLIGLTYRIPVEFVICLISICVIWYIYYFKVLFFYRDKISSLLLER